jgi:hypothetical protein
LKPPLPRRIPIASGKILARLTRPRRLMTFALVSQRENEHGVIHLYC